MKLPQQVIWPKHPHKASQSQESSYSTLAQKQRVSCFNLISDSRISSAVMCSPQCWCKAMGTKLFVVIFRKKTTINWDILVV